MQIYIYREQQIVGNFTSKGLTNNGRHLHCYSICQTLSTSEVTKEMPEKEKDGQHIIIKFNIWTKKKNKTENNPHFNTLDLLQNTLG